MLYISISENAIEAIETSKNVLGKESIIAVSRKELPSGIIIDGQISDDQKLNSIFSELLKESYPKPIKDRTVSLVVPDNPILIKRFTVKDTGIDIAKYVIEEAKKEIPYEVISLENFYQVLETNETDTKIYYTAMLKKTILNFNDFFKSRGFELKFLSYLSLSLFSLVSTLIAEGEKVIFCEVEKKQIGFFLFDRFGLVYSFIKKAGTSFVNTISDAINRIKTDKDISINKLILAGGSSIEVHTGDLSSKGGFNIVKIGEFLDALLEKNRIQMDTGGISKILFANPLSVFFFTKEIEPANFALDINSFENTEKIPEISASAEVKPVSKPFNKLLIPLFAALIGFIIVIAGFNLLTSKKGMSFPFISSPTMTPTPTVIPSNTPTPTIDPKLSRKDLKIAVQNGTEKSGYAKDIASYLENKGYKNINKGNADKSDYEKTLIRIKDSKKNYLTLLVSDLRDKVDTSTVDTLEGDNKFDAVVILGNK